MRKVPDPRASLAFLGLWLWEGEARAGQVLALSPAGCRSACVGLIRPFVQPPFLSIGPSFLHPCWGHKEAIVGVVGSCQGLSKIICMVCMICFLLACVCVCDGRGWGWCWGSLSEVGARKTLRPRPQAVKGEGVTACPGSCPLITAP